MKKLFATIALALLLSVSAMADFTEHPRYAQIHTRLLAFINAVHDAQADYFAVNSKFFQGILTPDTPQDGLTDADINWAIHPQTGQDASWKEFAPNVFKSNVKIPFQIAINTYDAPTGSGWILYIEIYIDGYGPDEFGNSGNHWVYVHHEGPGPITVPEDHLSKWFIMLPPELP